jgi:hypothetical protein
MSISKQLSIRFLYSKESCATVTLASHGIPSLIQSSVSVARISENPMLECESKVLRCI